MNSNDDVGPLEAFTQVGHAFFARDGVKLAFGQRWDGALIHISRAARGKACGCECPAPDCRRKLIARKPDSAMAHHFSHAPLTAEERAAGKSPNCKYGAMTALHRYAQELLDEKRSLVLPPVGASFGEFSTVMRGAEKYEFDSAKLETMDGETVPDVILYKGGHSMHVEIYVTNRCGAEKRAKLVAANISAVEIDLSAMPRNASAGEVEQALLNAAPREWIHNRRAVELLAELKSRAADKEARARKRRLEVITEAEAAYAEAQRTAATRNWKASIEVKTAIELGDGKLLNAAVDGEGYFAVHPRVWKALVLKLLHDRLGGCHSASIVSEMERREWIIPRFKNLHSDGSSILTEAQLPEGGAEGAIKNYLGFLANKGVAEDQGWKWSYTQHHLDVLATRRATKERMAREAAERSARHERLGSLMNEILQIGQRDNALFDLQAWLTRPIERIVQCPRKMADAGDTSWHAFLKDLSLLLAFLKNASEGPVEDFGLPIQEALQAMRAAQSERQEARRREAEAVAQQESRARVSALEGLVKSLLDFDLWGWIDEPLDNLKGCTPRDSAAASVDQSAQARQQLQIFAAQMAVKAKWVDELAKEARNLLRREDMVKLYMDSADPRLPGTVSPRTYTRDEATMLECRALLRQRSGKTARY